MCLPANCSGVAWSTQWDSLSVFEGSREKDLCPVTWRERKCLPVPKVICCHSAIQRYLAPQQFWGGRPPGLMVIPAFTFSNQLFSSPSVSEMPWAQKNNNEYLCNAEFKQSSNAPQLYYQAGVIRQQFSQRTDRQIHTETDATYDVQKQDYHHTTHSSRTGTINWQQRRRQQNKWTARFFKASASTKTHPVPRRWSEIANAWQSHRYRHFTRIHTCATEHMPFLGRILVTGFSFQTLSCTPWGQKRLHPLLYFGWLSNCVLFW